MLIPLANQICAFCSRSSDPPNIGNPHRRQNGSRLCEEAKTTIRYVSALSAKEEEKENHDGCKRNLSRLVY